MGKKKKDDTVTKFPSLSMEAGEEDAVDAEVELYAWCQEKMESMPVAWMVGVLETVKFDLMMDEYGDEV